MPESEGQKSPTKHSHDQMLKLVAKSFFNELVNYGVEKPAILRVAGHLLDNVIQNNGAYNKEAAYYNRLFTIQDVCDEWATRRRLSLQGVTLTPLDPAMLPLIGHWLRVPASRDSFYPRFPESDSALKEVFQNGGREYFTILCEQVPAGFVGADHIDAEASHLEMRKLVGDPAMHGRGVGKRATFLFLYYVYVIRRFRKVQLHSFDTNIRNLNLNGRFGFELEGVFLEEAKIDGVWRDVIRMALSSARWFELFSVRPPEILNSQT
jgi:RimJ/RimL family protein N-acetyltransferase